MLGRLRIRGKLALVVALPLLAVALLTVPSVTSAMGQAQQAQQIRDAVEVASRAAALISEVRQERLLSLGYLFGAVDRSRLVGQSAQVSDRLADLRLDVAAGELSAGELTPALTTALDRVEGLAPLRESVLRRELAPDAVLTAFGDANLTLINELLLANDADLSTDGGRQLATLDTSLRINEYASQATDLLLVFTASGADQAAIGYLSLLRVLEDLSGEFEQHATAEQIAQLDLMYEAFAVRDITGVGVPLSPDPWTATAGISPFDAFPQLDSLSRLGRFVEAKVVTDALFDVDSQRQAALLTAYLVGFGAVLVLLTVVALTSLLARAVVRPLLGLTESANRVARLAEAELARIADGETDEAEQSPRIEPIHAPGRDEIGSLGRAFDRVQHTAVALVARQVASRRNVALMFGYLGRRTENLVSRQIALIDQLERDEADPDRLADLYRLDHISSRLRRNAGSLAALSGEVGADEHVAPLPLADAVRLALGEIEDFGRVDVEVPSRVMLAPAVIGDLVLVLAELMENATSFSPPHTRVTVSAVTSHSGATVSIVDQGIGMSATRLAEENVRLTHRERLDLAPTEVLGLFVVGRLARRHGLRVALSETPGGGVTAEIGLDRWLLAQVAPAALPVAPVAARPGLIGIERLASTLVNVESLSRADHALTAGHRWNAFAVPVSSARALPAAPSAPVDTSEAVAPAPAEAARAVVPVAPSSPAPASAGPGLRRRVPGATLGPVPPQASRPAGARAASAGPEEVRAMVDQLQDGVTRALTEIRTSGAREGTHHDA